MAQTSEKVRLRDTSSVENCQVLSVAQQCSGGRDEGGTNQILSSHYPHPPPPIPSKVNRTIFTSLHCPTLTLAKLMASLQEAALSR